MEPLTFEFDIEEFDRTLLPIDESLLRSSPEILARAIVEHLSDRFAKLGGTANVVQNGTTIAVTWLPSGLKDREKLRDYAIELLTRGAYGEAEPILRALLKADPDDTDAAVNLGMMLSDQQRLEEAIPMLERATQALPSSANAWNALGVAHLRAGDRASASEAMIRSHKLEPDNPYTLRNLGGILGNDDPMSALPYLRRAAELLPDDQQALYGYGIALWRTGHTENADKALITAVNIAPFTEIAEACRTARTKIAHEGMRESGGQVRMDVVMYITSALELFGKEGRQKTGGIIYEVAMLGRSGLDINDPEQKYSIKSLPGKFSGIHLLAIMYAGMKQLAPEQDAGVDFSKEYELALEMRKQR